MKSILLHKISNPIIILMNNNTIYEKELAFQADRRKAGVEFIKIISDLWYDKSIELVLFEELLLELLIVKLV